MLTTSYLQENKHLTKSDKYQIISPKEIGEVLAEKNFTLTSLLTGKGRKEDRKDFQRTIARYRSNDAFAIEGLSLDVIYISKHLTGQDEIRLGLYRGACANQWTVGTLFDLIKIRHSGNALGDVYEGLVSVLAQRDKLVETITKMQAMKLTPDQIKALAKKYAEIRLGERPVIDAQFEVLDNPRRSQDLGTDLWSVSNVLQENAVRYSIPYTMNSINKQGNQYVRSMSTRVVKESSPVLVDMNAKFFDASVELLAA